jgi:hypothetical protein
LSFAIGGAVAIAVSLSRNVIRNDVAATIDVASGRLVSATGGSITVAAISTSQQLMNGATPLDIKSATLTKELLDAGGDSATEAVSDALPASAPLAGKVSIFTITTGQRWQVVSEQGTAYLIEREGTDATYRLTVRRASIAGYTLAAAIAGGLAGVAAAGTGATNQYSTATRASITGAGTVQASNRIDLSASDTASVTAYLPTATVAIGIVGAAVSASVSRNSILSVVDAFLGGTVTLKPCTASVSTSACNGATAPAPGTDGGLSAIATSALVVHATTLSVAVAVAPVGSATAVSDARSYIGGSTQARTGAVTVTGPAALMTLRATSTVNGTAVMQTGAGSVIAVATADGKVKVDHAVRAYVGEAADITVRSLVIDAARTSSATASQSSGSGGLLVAVQAARSRSRRSPCRPTPWARRGPSSAMRCRSPPRARRCCRASCRRPRSRSPRRSWAPSPRSSSCSARAARSTSAWSR